MPNKWTFTIKPIKKLIKEEAGIGEWVDPFAGRHSPAKIRNDINPNTNTHHHKDALEFLKLQKNESFDGCFYDPPYSMRQAKECYDSYGMGKLDLSVGNMRYWSECKNEIRRILKLGGKVICFGWTSMGLGKKRGFVMTRILLVPHGGSKNDTIVTVEIKKNTSLFSYVGD